MTNSFMIKLFTLGIFFILSSCSEKLSAEQRAVEEYCKELALKFDDELPADPLLLMSISSEKNSRNCESKAYIKTHKNFVDRMLIGGGLVLNYAGNIYEEKSNNPDLIKMDRSEVLMISKKGWSKSQKLEKIIIKLDGKPVVIDLVNEKVWKY